MTPMVWILLLAACGALGWIVALVLGFRAVNAEERERLAWRQVAQMRRELEAVRDDTTTKANKEG